jgi:hypothetical protein
VRANSKLVLPHACMYVAGLAPYEYCTLVHVIYGELYWYSITYFDIFF